MKRLFLRLTRRWISINDILRRDGVWSASIIESWSPDGSTTSYYESPKAREYRIAKAAADLPQVTLTPGQLQTLRRVQRAAH